MESPPIDAELDEELTLRTVARAAELLTEARRGTARATRRRERRLRRIMADEDGTGLVFSLADRVLRPPDSRVAARQLISLTSGRLGALSAVDGSLLRLAGFSARLLPGPVVALAAARLRRETASLVYPAEPAALGRRLAGLRAGRGQGSGRPGLRPNLNLLGEAVLGHEEADRRTAAVEALLRRPDVDCVSVKVSSVASGLSLIDFDGSVERVASPLGHLYRVAMEFDPPKLVNLDMEESRDLDLTLEVFTRVLQEPDFSTLTAGIALQAYLPDSHAALDRVLAFSRARAQRGAAPVRVRLVKGANLAMERVGAELHGWTQAPYATKAETDASYKRMAFRLVETAGDGAVRVGIASHNLFDVALALELAERDSVPLDVEMLIGMADGQVKAASEAAGGLLVYVPATSRRDFRNALAYLARRLDENATPEGFLRHVLDLVPGDPAWDEQADRFRHAMRERHDIATEPRQLQDRTTGTTPLPPPRADGFVNEPDTDLTVAANRVWARTALRAARPPPPALASVADVDEAVRTAAAAAPEWSHRSGLERRRLCEAAADVMASGRASALTVMAAEAGKVFGEADPEVSEAVDYARWYGRAAEEIDAVTGEAGRGAPVGRPLGVVVVASPWNFPYAIPAGGVLAALAAGNTVLLKPSPEALATGALLVEQLHAAGVPPAAVQLVAAPDDAAGRRLITHPEVGGIVLTGSLETARMFRRWIPERRVLAETSGKNSLIVAATADVDQAVRDVVASAFGHSGQKCSAASIVIVDASLYDEGSFLRQLADAVRSLRVGAASEPRTEVGPIVGPFTRALERALSQLDPGESWLVTPKLLDPDRRLWAPGVRIGVRPGSWSHLTEWFGPVLGVMRSTSLGQAMEWQNAVGYGLTAGLHSLDPVEHHLWADGAEAGNLYVNRTTTGAVVGRQPFGGWKGSVLGPTAKAGGPNYLIGLRRWADTEAHSPEVARASYLRWWRDHFSVDKELAGLRAESNVLRYRRVPAGVMLRAAAGTGADEILKARAASEVTGTPVTVSDAEHESPELFIARLQATPDARVRLLGVPERQVVQAAAELGMSVLDEPICSHGRIELVRWLREQVVTRSLHRYGNVVYR